MNGKARKVISDKNGKVTTVWVNPDDSDASGSSRLPSSTKLSNSTSIPSLSNEGSQKAEMAKSEIEIREQTIRSRKAGSAALDWRKIENQLRTSEDRLSDLFYRRGAVAKFNIDFEQNFGMDNPFDQYKSSIGVSIRAENSLVSRLRGAPRESTFSREIDSRGADIYKIDGKVVASDSAAVRVDGSPRKVPSSVTKQFAILDIYRREIRICNDARAFLENYHPGAEIS